MRWLGLRRRRFKTWKIMVGILRSSWRVIARLNRMWRIRIRGCNRWMRILENGRRITHGWRLIMGGILYLLLRLRSMKGFLIPQRRKWKEWTLSSGKKLHQLKISNLPIKNYQWNFNNPKRSLIRCKNFRITYKIYKTKMTNLINNSNPDFKNCNRGRVNLQKYKANFLY